MQSHTMGRAPRARRVLAYASRVMAVFVLIGYLTTIPPIDRMITGAEAMPILRVMMWVFFVIVLLTAALLWSAALWYAIVDPKSHAVPRGLIVALLIFGNFVAAFFYYFLFVRWQRDRAARSQHDASS